MQIYFRGDALYLRPAAALLAAAAGLALAAPAGATITSVGDISPAVPGGGGNVAGPLRIGVSTVGSLTIVNGPAVNVTGNSTIVGDGAGATGLVTLQGFGSNLSTANDLQVGNNGTGSVAMSATAQLTVADDLLLASNAGSTGDLFANDLGTVVNVADVAIIGGAGTSLAQVANGARVNAVDTAIGQLAGGDGRIVVSGHASLWQQTGGMTVGDAGRGDLQALTQGRINTTAAVLGNTGTGVGLALINGTGSLWTVNGVMHVAVGGAGNLRIFDGGRVNVTGAVRLGINAGSEARVTVSGAQSHWLASSTMTVGESGLAVMYVLAGGRVNSAAAKIGDNAGGRGEVLVDGADSTWLVGTLDVSEPGEATLTISNGGQVTALGATRVGAAGQLLLAGGRLDVDVAAGLTNSGIVAGSGRIDAATTNAATGRVRVRSGDRLTLAATLANAGVVDVDGGELEVLGAATNTGDVDARDATLRFTGGLTNPGGLAVTGGAVNVHGAVNNAVAGQLLVAAEAHAVFHDAVTSAGQLFVMPGAQFVALENLALGSGSLTSIELGSAALETHGSLEVGGQATLSGNLAVSLADGTTPAIGDSYRLLTAAGGVSGTFAATSLPTLPAGLGWQVSYDAASVSLNVTAAAGADFNGDGFVNSADFAIFRGGFGTAAGATTGSGDADGDGDVDGGDFLAWQQQFGAGGGAQPLGSGVPEPATAAGLLTAALATSSVCRRRR